MQFGFVVGLWTSWALFSLQVLIQRARDVNSDVFACFIDFEKTFNRVPHGKLIDILRTSGIDVEDIRVILNLYVQQKAIVRFENELSEIFTFGQRVRHGCILLLALFNIYSENIGSHWMNQRTVNWQLIHNIRYADDNLLLADSADSLQRMMDNVVETCNEYELKLIC